MSSISHNQISGIPRLDTAVLRREAVAQPGGALEAAAPDAETGVPLADTNLTRIPFKHLVPFVDPPPPPPQARHGVPLVQRLRP